MPPRKRETEQKTETDPGEVEYVGVVSRDGDGKALQRAGFKVLLPEGASDADKAAAWNLDGELPPESRVHYYKPWL